MENSNKNTKDNKPVIGITLGDINGIGPEVVIKALADSRILNYITPVIFGSTKALSFYRKMLNTEDFNYSQIKNIDGINYKRINVINCWTDTVEIKAGVDTPEAGKCAFAALEQAMKYLKEEKIDGLVTAPINKKNMQSDDFNFMGHTDYITKELGQEDSLMMMVSDDVRVGVVTDHIPVNEISKNIDEGKVEKKLRIMMSSLKNDFGIDKPRIAVLGLNPHAGEEGLLGKEEIDVLIPVINNFKKKGNLVFGPFPADGFFGTAQYLKYDGVLAMYHDQGLVPFKVLSFERGVNFTAGIPRVRTSPDHGTAYNIAGKDMADPTSMREALYLAADVIKKRWLKSELVNS